MKSMSQLLIVLTVLNISIFMTGCQSQDESPEESVTTESPTETEETLDSEQLDGVASVEWPQELMGPLPKPKDEISLVYTNEMLNQTQVTVLFENEESAKDYLKQVQALGYEEAYFLQRDDGFQYTGVKDDNTEVNIWYDTAEYQSNIIFRKESEEAIKYYKSK